MLKLSTLYSLFTQSSHVIPVIAWYVAVFPPCTPSTENSKNIGSAASPSWTVSLSTGVAVIVQVTVCLIFSSAALVCVFSNNKMPCLVSNAVKFDVSNTFVIFK